MDNTNSKRDVKDLLNFINKLVKLDNYDNDVEIVVYSDEKKHKARVVLDYNLPLIQSILERKIYSYDDAIVSPYKKVKKLENKNERLKNQLNKYKNRKAVKIADKLKSIGKKLQFKK